MLEEAGEVKTLLEESARDSGSCRACVRKILERSGQGIIIMDSGSVIIYLNPAAAAMLGSTVAALTGKPYEVPPLSDEKRELSLSSPAGRMVEVEIWAMETEWEGKPARLISLHEITKRKLAEVAMRESEEKFSRAFLAVPSLLVIVTLPYERYVEVNEAFEQLCGYRQEEVFGRTLSEIDIWQEPADRTRTIRTMQEQGRLRGLEMNFRKRSGGGFVGLLSAEIVDLCGVRCMIGIITDITERKQSEEALRRSEEKFAKVFRYVPSLLVVSSTLKEGRLIEVNKAFEKTFMYGREEVIGRSSLDLNLWANPEDRNAVLQALREEGGVHNRELRFRDRSGREFVGLYSATIIDINGEECLLSILNDITERKAAEKEIELLNATLAGRALELESANRELEAFNYTVSHDLRRPLTTINGYCQIIRELCGGRLDEQCLGFLEEIYEGTLQMSQLIGALLKFSRLTHSELQRQEVDLCNMAEVVAGELRLSDPGRGVTFRIAKGITVNGDPDLLRVVMENLLGNAWKYTGKKAEALIEFGSTEVDGKTACFVRDNVTGFDMTYADTLFLPFHRLTGTEEFAGHGIGLATVERIIRRHGGRVWAEAEPGKGAAFYFTLKG